MTRDEIRHLQHGMNIFVKKYMHGLGPILEDGKIGQATNGRIRTCKYYLGYLKPINAEINMDFRQRLYHPKTRKYSTYKRIRRGMERRIRQRKLARQNDKHAHKNKGVGFYDGIPVANVAIPILQWCRANGWGGRLVSGYRTPAYSESLCYRMCGRPSCPGMCAGRATNHAWALATRFAMDVSDYMNFRRIVARCPISPHVSNHLPRDLVHFSPSGN